MHINHFRGETRVSSGRRRKSHSHSWGWYKRRWNRLHRRWLNTNLATEPEGPPTTSRYSRHQKTWLLYW